MGFVAGDVTEPMDWDFTAFGTPEDKGTIPEPSAEDVDLFGRRYLGLLQELRQSLSEDENAVPGESTDEAAQRIVEHAAKPLMERIEEWHARTMTNREDIMRVNAEMRRILADVCGGSPTLAQIELLPSRILRLFTAWLHEQLTAPKAKDGVLSSTRS